MKILVTGDAGLVGSAVARHFLEQGADVRGLDVRDAINGEWDHVTSDIRHIYELETNPLEGVEVVVHAAALIDLSPEDPQLLRDINVGGTNKLLQLAAMSGVSCFVYISSQEVCWDGGHVRMGDERANYPAAHGSEYAASMAEAERLVISSNCEKMATCSLRPCGVYGIGDRVRIPPVIASTLKLGYLPVLGNNNGLYSHVFAGNVAHAAYLAATKLAIPGSGIWDVAGSCYYIADKGTPDTFSNFVEKYVTATCGPRERMVVPRWVAMAGAFTCDMLYHMTCRRFKPPITRDGVRSITQDLYFSIEKAERELGYRALFSEESAFQLTVEWLNATEPWL